MPKFRKKPVVIEAVQFEGYLTRHPALIRRGTWEQEGLFEPTMICEKVFIRTLEGEMEVMMGDWIITGVKGENYPCKPDIFEATYEKVET